MSGNLNSVEIVINSKATKKNMLVNMELSMASYC